MTLTTEFIWEQIRTADEIMHECFPKYQTPTYTDIKISKARSFWAQIKYISEGTYSLKVSNVFEEIADEEVMKIRLISCMLHELVHTLPKCFNHGKYFKKACAVINTKFPGYNLQRATSMSEYNIVNEPKPIKYIMSCGHCGATWNYRRKPNITNMKVMNASYRCACGAADFHLKEV